MKILVINDDGIESAGLWGGGAGRCGQPARCSWWPPRREQSGVGASLTLHSPVKVAPWTPAPRVPGIRRRYAPGDGPTPPRAPPGDCCILALEDAGPPGVDLVVSGINSGSNCGWGRDGIRNRGRRGARLSTGAATPSPCPVGSVTAPRYDVAGAAAGGGWPAACPKGEGEPLFLNLNIPKRRAGVGEGNPRHQAGRPVLPRVGAPGNHRRRRQGLPHSPQPPPANQAQTADSDIQALKEKLCLHNSAEAGHGRRCGYPRSGGRCWTG